MSRLLLQAVSVSLAFGTKTVLDRVSFSLYEGDRLGLIGENGAGKSSLLRILSGDLDPDSGRVTRSCPVSSVRQWGDAETSAALDPRLRSRFRAEESRPGLSGGEKTRRRLAVAFSSGAGVLLADEPTTDLDSQGCAELREELLAWPGALVLVSHDRALLDAVCTSIAELRDGQLALFPGGYSAYWEERERRMEAQRGEYARYNEERARLEQAIQNKREKATQVRKAPTRMGNSEARLHKRSSTDTMKKIAGERKALESRLARLEKPDRLREDPSVRMDIRSAAQPVSRTALEVRGLTVRVGGKLLLQDASMRLPAGTVTALIGPNGCGKTTLIRRILQGGDPRIRLSPGVEPAVFSQDHTELLDPARTALENVLAKAAPGENVLSNARTVLARLGISSREVDTAVSFLSGGERAKVSLACLLLGSANLLLLDEPTNHLDVFTMEALEPLVRGYSGTVLLVSHDERFVAGTADRLVFFDNGALRAFEGTWEEYRQSLLRPDRAGEDAELATSVLEMRMAVLAARLAAPAKGDDPAALNAEYLALAARLRELRQRG